jgi:outer membrane protein
MSPQSSDALLVIDMQNDFCPGGALAVSEGDAIVSRINSLSSKFEHVILTQDWHPAGHISFATSHLGKGPYTLTEVSYGPQALWPEHCVQASQGADFHPMLDIPHAELILRKGFRREIDSYSAFLENDHTTPTGLAAYLRERGLTRLFFCGLAYDYCVRFSAIDGVALGFECLVLEDVSRPVNLPGSVEATNSAFDAAGVSRIASGPMNSLRFSGFVYKWAFYLSALGVLGLRVVSAQCSGLATTPAEVANCLAHNVPRSAVAVIDTRHPYTLAELIDLAEQHNPRTRIVWERAKQAADRLGIAKSAYYPVLDGLAVFGDERIISPFPKPLAPRGYTMVEVPIVQPEITLQYLLFDFGKREARVDAATAGKLAAGANFIQANQEVAFRVASGYYRLLTAQERLQATQDTLKTAQTTQDAAEAQLANGRSTMPDVLNARAETAQAVFDMESADGDEKIARVTLSETIGAEPSPDILIESQHDSLLPGSLELTIDQLIDHALSGRPDLMAQAAEIRAANDEVKQARDEYRPKIVLTGSGAQTAIWPTTDYGELGPVNQPTWSASLGVEWRIFDGGARRNELAAAQSRKRAAQDEMTDKHDLAVREVWSSYIAFRTARRKQQAAVSLLNSANTSYQASLEAYKYGVKNLVDVLTAEKQLAQARLSGVSARSQLFLEAVDLEFVTGNLLRNSPPLTKLEPVPPSAESSAPAATPVPTEPKS